MSFRFLWPDTGGTITAWEYALPPFGVNYSLCILNAALYLLDEQNLADGRYIHGIIELFQQSLYVDAACQAWNRK